MRYAVLSLLLLVSACGPAAPEVTVSREALWQQYGGQSVDQVILNWGAPAAETKLTNGSRMLSYRHTTVYDAGSPYESAAGCEVTFLAAPPSFRISDIAMKGSDAECRTLAQGRTGMARYTYTPPAGIYPYPYRRYPYPYPY